MTRAVNNYTMTSADLSGATLSGANLSHAHRGALQ